MNKTFNGHTPNENSLLDLDHSDTHIHNIKAKRCNVNNDSATVSASSATPSWFWSIDDKPS